MTDMSHKMHMYYGVECSEEEYTWLNKIFGNSVVLKENIEEKLLEYREHIKPGIKSLGPSALQMQEGGNHYKYMAIQPIEFITANSIPFIEGCVIKYVTRHANKNGAEDIKKAIHFLNLLLELKYGDSK